MVGGTNAEINRHAQSGGLVTQVTFHEEIWFHANPMNGAAPKIAKIYPGARPDFYNSAGDSSKKAILVIRCKPLVPRAESGQRPGKNSLVQTSSRAIHLLLAMCPE